MKKIFIALALILGVKSAQAWNWVYDQAALLLAFENMTPAAQAEMKKYLGEDIRKQVQTFEQARKKGNLTESASWRTISLDMNLKPVVADDNNAIAQLEKAVEVVKNRASKDNEEVELAIRKIIDENAGYKKEMYDLMKVNPGLKSRIPFEIEFPNYTRSELEEIFFMMLGDKFEYGDSFKEALHLFFESLSDEVLNSVEFSNARFVRNLFERVWGKAAYRRAMNGEEKIIIQKEDLDYVTETAEFKGLLENKAKQKIGFSYE